MPRPAKPYLHRGWWVTNIGGTRHKLCREEDGCEAAQDAFDELRQERRQNGGCSFPNLRVAELVALFLDTVKIEKSFHTYLDYQRWLTEFAKLHSHRPARGILRQDALAFRNALATRTYTTGKVTVDRKKGPALTNQEVKVKTPKPYKPKTVNHAIVALKRCWNWGIENDYLPPKNPFVKLPLLHSEGRQRVITDEEFRALLRHNTDALFRQFLLMLRFTPARPGEIRKLTWTMLDWPNHRLVILRHKSSRTQKTPKPRIIPIPVFIENMLRWLQKRHGDQPYCFLNRDGKPWTKDATVQRMESLRRRAGIEPDENGEQLVLYHNRHTYITTAAGSEGISGPLLQQLAGHTDPRTTERYAHLANREIQRAGHRVAESLRLRKPGK
ncbi:MAG TPA: tyrosine-type recombinase/integrase [Gemmataceae bacterium]|nr:tyrosine-type recombinase/integrase [Gemmataceae bacterium]